MTAQKHALESWQHRLEILGVTFAVLVAVGVIGESYLEKPKLVHNSTRLVAIGVSGELAISVLLLAFGRRSRWVQHKLDREIEANAEQARQRFENHIADLKSKVTETKTAVFAQSPRVLTKGQRDRIVWDCSKFRGQKVFVFYIWGNSEASSYASAIISALLESGWNFWKGSHAQPQMFPTSFRNVAICISPQCLPTELQMATPPVDISPDRLPPAAIALSITLSSIGIIDKPGSFTTDPQLATDEIALRISGQLDRP